MDTGQVVVALVPAFRWQLAAIRPENLPGRLDGRAGLRVLGD